MAYDEMRCVICGAGYIPKAKNQKYCSKKCQYEAQKKNRVRYNQRRSEKKRKARLEKPPICLICGKPILVPKSRKYCSDDCYKVALSEYGKRYRSTHMNATDDMVESEKERKRRRPKVKSLAQISREAKEHGMDYGSYVVWLEQMKG